MPKLTPAQRFNNIFKRWTSGATEAERATGEKKVDEWLAKNGKTRADIAALLAEAHADDLKANPPPPPPDPRSDPSVRFDPERHNPASLVEGILKGYVTMSEHVRVIYSLAICLTHVLHTRFSIAPRVVFVSRKPESGKSIALGIVRALAFNTNKEAVGTGAAVEEHYAQGPCNLVLDEIKHADADTLRRFQRIWNVGHTAGPGSIITKMIGGKKRSISLFGMVFVAGVGKGIGRLLATQERSRTLRLEMQRYTKETMPPRNYWIKEERDDEAINAVYSLLCSWAAKAKLNPKPPMPPELIARDADNFRGLLAVADDCGGEWPRRAREALMVLSEQRRAEDPVIIILRHALVISDEVLGQQRFKGTDLDRELRRLDKPEMDWSRYRGLGGDEPEHPITARERAELLRESDVETKVMKPIGGGKPFRGLDRSWIVEALRKHDPPTPDDTEPGHGRLRLITPAIGFGLAASPILVTVFSQVPGPVVGAGLPGLVIVCSALVALARRRRRECASPAADYPPGR
jgi:Protein of unknown function (DUF3631)